MSSRRSPKRVLLDTDVISHLLRGTASAAMVAALARFPDEGRCVSAVSVGEVLYGLEKAGSRLARYRDEVERRFFRRTEIAPFDEDAARVYARLRAQLEAVGRPLSEPDLRIASTALSRDLVLATGNRAHFARVPGLKMIEAPLT